MSNFPGDPNDEDEVPDIEFPEDEDDDENGDPDPDPDQEDEAPDGEGPEPEDPDEEARSAQGEQAPPPNELELLKQRARRLGIVFSNNIGLAALKSRVNNHLTTGKSAAALAKENAKAKEAARAVPQAVAPRQAEAVRAAPRKLTKAEMETQLRQEQQAEQLRLVRVRIANMNPSKKDLHGEIFTVANRYLGIVKKFVPYGEATDNGYHIPFVIYTQLKERKFLQIKTRRDPRQPGQILVDQRWVPEFNIEIMDPLTPDELAKLAAQQMASKGLEG